MTGIIIDRPSEPGWEEVSTWHADENSWADPCAKCGATPTGIRVEQHDGTAFDPYGFKPPLATVMSRYVMLPCGHQNKHVRIYVKTARECCGQPMEHAEVHGITVYRCTHRGKHLKFVSAHNVTVDVKDLKFGQ